MKNIDKIIKLIFKEYEEDEKKQLAFKGLFAIIAPDTHTPYIEISLAEKMTNMLGLIYDELSKDILYFLYEAPSFYSDGVNTYKTGCSFIDEDTNKDITINSNKEAMNYLINKYK